MNRSESKPSSLSPLQFGALEMQSGFLFGSSWVESQRGRRSSSEYSCSRQTASPLKSTILICYSPVHRYIDYKSTLDKLLSECSWGRGSLDFDVVHSHLNGGASNSLRALVTRCQIRSSGAFFTGEQLGRDLVRRVRAEPNTHCAALDPTCGAGDLLLRWSERLPTYRSLHKTLKTWGELIHGRDIHPQFLAVAKRRLALAAIARGSFLPRGQLDSVDDYFPNICRQSILKKTVSIPPKSVILMNPPFTKIATPANCQSWSSGSVSFAAVAALRCISESENSQRICAILPDVLRSGSRYSAWRKQMERLLGRASIKVVGRFDTHADVDVFVLDAVVGRKKGLAKIDWVPSNRNPPNRTLADVFEVRVGTVIPHRHEPSGRKVRYLTTSSARPWSEMIRIKDGITFSGNVVKGPFLAVRRTSSPSDLSRAIATLVATKQQVALENHLISLRPKNGSVDSCREMMKYLKSEEVRQWLDERIRCRHLTVSSLKEIPIPDNL